MDKMHYQYSRTVAIIDIVKWRPESEIEQRTCEAHLQLQEIVPTK
jgi:hypothetical protein